MNFTIKPSLGRNSGELQVLKGAPNPRTLDGLTQPCCWTSFLSENPHLGSNIPRLCVDPLPPFDGLSIDLLASTTLLVGNNLEASRTSFGSSSRTLKVVLWESILDFTTLKRNI